MKKFLSVLMLGLLMGAVSYPILFNEADAGIASIGRKAILAVCQLEDGTQIGYGNVCDAGSGSCEPNECPVGLTIPIEL